MTSYERHTPRHSYVSLVGLVVMVTSLSSSSASCPSPCSCSADHAESSFVNCSDRNLDRLPANLPVDATELDLTSNRILNVSQVSFSSLTNLRRLSLENCLLERLERNTFRSLKLLETLDLSRNRIRYIDVAAFFGLSSLRHLHLSGNELDTLPGYIFRGLTLDSLHLDGNKIESIPDETFQLTLKVSSLNLDENRLARLTQSNLRPLKESLTRITVSENKRPLIIEGDAFAGFHFTSVSIVSSNLSDVQFLAHLHTRYLDVSSNSFQSNLIFPRSPHLTDSCETLRIADSNLHEFSEDLAFSLRRVKSLDLSGNLLTYINAPRLFRYTPELVTLNLSRNNFVETYFSDDFSSALVRLRSLDLSRCGITSINPEMFRGADQLEIVDLSFNRLQVFSEDIAQYFEKISTFDITGNPLHCNCEMQWFRNWLGTAPPETNVGSAKCATPILFRESSVSGVNNGVQNDDVLSRAATDFICTEPVVQISSNQNLDEGTSFALSCRSQSDPASDVVWTLNSKESIRITPDRDRTRVLTDAPLQLSRLRTHQAGWYSCSASNILAETVRYVYIHIVTSSIPPADVDNLVYPEVPKSLKPQRPLSSTTTVTPSTLSIKTRPTVFNDIPTDSISETNDYYSRISTESFFDDDIKSTKINVVTKIEDVETQFISVLTQAASDVLNRTSSTIKETSSTTTTTTTSSTAHIQTSSTSDDSNLKPGSDIATTTATNTTTTTDAVVLMTSQFPTPGMDENTRTFSTVGDVLTAAANDAKYDATTAALFEGNRLLWIIIISALSTLVLVGIVLIVVCVCCCRRCNSENQHYGDLPVKTNTRSRRTATGEKRRVFKTPPDLDLVIPLNNRMTPCTDLTM